MRVRSIPAATYEVRGLDPDNPTSTTFTASKAAAGLAATTALKMVASRARIAKTLDIPAECRVPEPPDLPPMPTSGDREEKFAVAEERLNLRLAYLSGKAFAIQRATEFVNEKLEYIEAPLGQLDDLISSIEDRIADLTDCENALKGKDCDSPSALCAAAHEARGYAVGIDKAIGAVEKSKSSRKGGGSKHQDEISEVLALLDETRQVLQTQLQMVEARRQKAQAHVDEAKLYALTRPHLPPEALRMLMYGHAPASDVLTEAFPDYNPDTPPSQYEWADLDGNEIKSSLLAVKSRMASDRASKTSAAKSAKRRENRGRIAKAWAEAEKIEGIK